MTRLRRGPSELMISGRRCAHERQLGNLPGPVSLRTALDRGNAEPPALQLRFWKVTDQDGAVAGGDGERRRQARSTRQARLDSAPRAPADQCNGAA